MFNKLPYGCISTIRQLKLNRSRRYKRRQKPKGTCKNNTQADFSNLHYIDQTNEQQLLLINKLPIFTANVRSIKNKIGLLHNYIIDNNIDIAVITETWLRNNEVDSIWTDTCDLTISGYKIFARNRSDRKGGGVMIAVHPRLHCELVSSQISLTLESIIVKIKTKIPITVCCVYHPPTGSCPGNTLTAFNDELTELLTNTMPNHKNLILSGNFNINLNDVSSMETCIFRDIMSALGLQQHVKLATYTSGNTLDLVFTEECTDYTVLASRPDRYLSDHKSVITTIAIPRYKVVRKKIKVRKIKTVTETELVQEFEEGNIVDSNDINIYAESLEIELRRVTDVLAPEKEISVTCRQLKPWYNTFIRDQKKVVRNCERKFNSYGQAHQWKAYQSERNRLNKMVKFEKKQILSSKVLECGRDAKKLFSLVNSLTNSGPGNPLPEGNSQDLANEFADFFLSKIERIREKFEGTKPFECETDCGFQFKRFPPLTEKQVESIIRAMNTKTCELDPIPTDLLKRMLPTCISSLTKLVNISMDQGVFCDSWKQAIVRPLLKKIGLELINKNYRPVSNLSFLSKLLERAMLFHLTAHCEDHHLMPDFQSAYRPKHSCETALVSLVNDALWAMEEQKILSICILDLSAAFDTVDHDILLEILSKKFGFRESALKWFETYLRPRSFKVCVDNCYSQPKELTFSVPQGSASGAFVFLCYASPIERVIPDSITLNGFADDHSIRKTFRPSEHEESCMKVLFEETLLRIKDWMTAM